MSIQARSLEATPGFEPGIRALQARALPLGYAAIQITDYKLQNADCENSGFALPHCV